MYSIDRLLLNMLVPEFSVLNFKSRTVINSTPCWIFSGNILLQPYDPDIQPDYSRTAFTLRSIDYEYAHYNYRYNW